MKAAPLQASATQIDQTDAAHAVKEHSSTPRKVSHVEPQGFWSKRRRNASDGEKRFDPMWYWVIGFLVFYFIFCVYWITIIPMCKAPDEVVRIPVSDYIMKYGHLPNAWEEMVRIHNWGFSYALRPILANTISALFMWIASLFSGDLWVQVIAGRLVSAISATVLVYYMFRIARELKWSWPWAWGVAAFTGLIPQVTFLSSYINNDIFSMACCAAVIFAWGKGIKTKWSWKACIRLSITLGVTILSYYNAYPYVLFSIPLFFMTIFHKGMTKEEKKTAWKKTGLIVLVTFLLAGWWFIRNIVLYDGDMLGSQTREIMGEMYAYDGLKPSQVRRLKRDGVPYLAVIRSNLLRDPWWLITFRSAYASVGFVELYLDSLLPYKIMGWIFIIGWVVAFIRWMTVFVQSCIAKFKDHEKNMELIFYFFVVLSAILVFFLAVYYSWADDYQPQGRYVLPALASFMLVMFYGGQWICGIVQLPFKNRRIRESIAAVFCACLIAFNVTSQIRIIQLTHARFDSVPRIFSEYVDHRIKFGPEFETDGNGHTVEEYPSVRDEIISAENAASPQ